MMDVERVVAQRLMGATGIKAVLEVPEERPDEFISVEMTGGTGDRFIRQASLAVQKIHIGVKLTRGQGAGGVPETRQRAAEISRLVEAAVSGIADAEQNVFRAVATGSYRWPDPDSGQARYQTNVELTICE